ncbi:hypothetical protein ACFL1B_04935 [Nanoarchaeota archaeon]
MEPSKVRRVSVSLALIVFGILYAPKVIEVGVALLFGGILGVCLALKPKMKEEGVMTLGYLVIGMLLVLFEMFNYMYGWNSLYLYAGGVAGFAIILSAMAIR